MLFLTHSDFTASTIFIFKNIVIPGLPIELLLFEVFVGIRFLRFSAVHVENDVVWLIVMLFRQSFG